LLGTETGNRLESHVFHLLPRTLVELLRHLRVHQCLLLLSQFLELFHAQVKRSEVHPGCLFKRVDFPNSGFNRLRILMRTHALYNSVVLVGEENVTLGVELEEDVETVFGTEFQVDDSFDSDLSDVLKGLAFDVFSELNNI